MSFSANLDSRGVTEIGRKSLRCLGSGTFGIGVTTADNQLLGTCPVRNEILKIRATIDASSYEQRLNNHAGKQSTPGDVFLRCLSKGSN